MKNIIMIAHYTQLEGEIGNSRFKYILDNVDSPENIELITSTFEHNSKSQREHLDGSTQYKVTKLFEPGYGKNISLARLYSGKIFANNLKKYLSTREKPSMIYCAVPSLDVARVAASYCILNDIEFIIDVQDLWPEAFEMVFNVPILSKSIFFPFKKKAEKIYRAADTIISVSQTYLDVAKSKNIKNGKHQAVFLGTELNSEHDSIINERLARNSEFVNLVYCGTLGESYDIKMVIDALTILNDSRIKLTVLGDGPKQEEFEAYSKNKGLNINFTGRVSYDLMFDILLNSDIAVNPIKKNSAGSIINKVGDYAAAGLPVVNTQESLEYRNLVDQYQVGFNCDTGDSAMMAMQIKKLIEDRHLLSKFSINNRKLAKEKFNRTVTYKPILELFNYKG